MKNQILVKVEEMEDRFNITYLCAETEEEYYNGNHDAMNHWSIDKDSLNDPKDKEELIEQIKLYDTSFENKEIVTI